MGHTNSESARAPGDNTAPKTATPDARMIRDLWTLFSPRDMMRTGLAFVLQSAGIVKDAFPLEDGRLAWREFHNKLEAYYLFEHVDSILQIPSGAKLEQMIEMTARLGPFYSTWATEGLGHYYAYVSAPHLCEIKGQFPGHLLGEATGIPRENMVPLHAGMGLALAEAVLARGFGVQEMTTTFVQLCRANSRTHYWPIAAEALGLVVATLYPDLVAPLDRHFSQEEELLAYFWHGIGRGLYFAPANSLPHWSTPWQGIQGCLRAPHETARRNAVAGFIWAMVLVNLRNPEIVAAFLDRRGTLAAAGDAFANGVFSALAVWLHCAPHDSSVSALAAYRPDPRGRGIATLWQTQIQQPAALAWKYRETGRGRDSIAEVFRYRPISSFQDLMQI